MDRSRRRGRRRPGGRGGTPGPPAARTASGGPRSCPPRPSRLLFAGVVVVVVGHGGGSRALGLGDSRVSPLRLLGRWVVGRVSVPVSSGPGRCARDDTLRPFLQLRKRLNIPSKRLKKTEAVAFAPGTEMIFRCSEKKGYSKYVFEFSI